MLFRTTEGAVAMMSFSGRHCGFSVEIREVVNPKIDLLKAFVRKVCSLAYCHELTQQRITKEKKVYNAKYPKCCQVFVLKLIFCKVSA